MRRDYSLQERLERACMRAVMHIRGMWEEKGPTDTRLIEALIIPDELTVIGYSKSIIDRAHREHVVPRRVIIMECVRMLEAGASNAAIAAMVQTHLKIVKISKEEAALLDGPTLRLRQKMPPGWTFGDDIFARLKMAGIEWAYSADNTRSEVDNF